MKEQQSNTDVAMYLNNGIYSNIFIKVLIGQMWITDIRITIIPYIYDHALTEGKHKWINKRE